MRDTSRLRNYRGLKLASWLSQGSYWVDTLTEAQTVNLINRTLYHPEVAARWPKLTDIEVEFPTRGTTAWAERKRGGKGTLTFPPGTKSPLLVLHEFAHLLATRKPEAHHGAGFTAIHMMLVELMAPDMLRPLIAAYHATGMQYDPSLIPEPQTPSTYVPIVAGAPLHDSITHMRALLASGVLDPEERRTTESAITRLKKKETGDHAPLLPLPVDVRIPTAALLRCNTPEAIAKVVLDSLRNEMLPPRMRPIKKTKKKGQPHGTPPKVAKRAPRAQ